MFENCRIFRIKFPYGERLNVMISEEMLEHFVTAPDDPLFYFIRRQVHRHKRDPRRAVIYEDTYHKDGDIVLKPIASFI